MSGEYYYCPDLLTLWCSSAQSSVCPDDRGFNQILLPVFCWAASGHTFDKKYVYFVYQKCLKCVFCVNIIMCFTSQIIRSRVPDNYIS